MKWRRVSGILCNRNVPLKLKVKFYHTAVRHVMLYKTECLTLKNQYKNKIDVEETRVLYWMCGKTIYDEIRTDKPIIEKMMEIDLRGLDI